MNPKNAPRTMKVMGARRSSVTNFITTVENAKKRDAGGFQK